VENAIFGFVLVCGFALLASPSVWLAHRRGRSMVIWGAVGALAPFLSILALALIGNSKKKEATAVH
jgi:hypothetical protein